MPIVVLGYGSYSVQPYLDAGANKYFDLMNLTFKGDYMRDLIKEFLANSISE